MVVSFKCNDTNIQLYYDENGMLMYVVDQATGKKMMKEVYEYDVGYRINNNMGYTNMDTCNVDCVRIIDLDLFVPKYIFVKNNR